MSTQGRPSETVQHASAQRLTESVQIGLKHHQSGDYVKAGQHYRDVLAAEPNHPDALHLLGVLAHQTGQPELAVQLIRHAIQSNPEIAVYHYNLGAALQQLGELDQAVAAYRAAIYIDPQLVQAYSSLGAILRRQTKLGEAAEAYRSAIRIRPDYAEAYKDFGITLCEQQQFDEAVAAHHEAIRIQPHYAEAHCNLGVALFHQCKLDEAIAAFRQAILSRPDYAQAHTNLGVALHAKGELDQSIVAHQQAIQSNPVLADSYYNLAAVLREQGRLDDAAAAFRQTIALKPDFAEAHNNLALTLTELGRLSESRAALEKAIVLAPRNTKYRYNLSQIAHFRGEDDAHLIVMEQLARENTSFRVTEQIELHFALGKAYADVGRHREAFEQWLIGNGLKRPQTQYDETAVLRMLKQTRAVFTRQLLRSRQNIGQQSSMPIFILGMPRSGTSLVEQIMASHSKVFGGGELFYLQRTVNGFERARGTGTFPGFIEGLGAEAICELGRRYLTDIKMLAPDALHVTDKTLANFVFVGLIHLLMPNAPVIHVNRNPLDTCLSCFSKLFNHGHEYTYDLFELGRYYKHYTEVMAHWNNVLPPQRILEIRYEDVVSDLEGQARRIFAYCGLDWNPRCLAFHQTQRSVRTASAMQVRLPIYNHAIGRWRAYEKFLEPLFAGLGSTAATINEGI